MPARTPIPAHPHTNPSQCSTTLTPHSQAPSHHSITLATYATLPTFILCRSPPPIAPIDDTKLQTLTHHGCATRLMLKHAHVRTHLRMQTAYRLRTPPNTPRIWPIHCRPGPQYNTATRPISCSEERKQDITKNNHMWPVVMQPEPKRPIS